MAFQQDMITRAPLHHFLSGGYVTNGAVPSQSIYNASTNVYYAYTNVLANEQPVSQDLGHTLIRYHLRTCTRPTPFGFFAGCGVATWDNQIQVNVQKAQYHTRFDHLVLHQLAQQLFSIAAIQNQLNYFPNTSLYAIHDEWRYVEYTLHKNKRDYRLSSVDASESLGTVMQFCQSGTRRLAITEHLVDMYEVSSEEAKDYVQLLIDNQLLVHHMEPTITGEEYLPRLIQWINSINGSRDPETTEALALLNDIDQRLTQIKTSQATVIEQGPAIANRLRHYLPEITENNLFQVDTIFPKKRAATSDVQHNGTLPTQLAEVMHVLNKLAPSATNTALTRFADRFSVRYGDQEIPLAEALDAEVGIDYLSETPTSLSPLVEKLNLPTSDDEQSLAWTKQQRWRWDLLQNATFHQQSTVELTDDMLKDFSMTEEDLPPSMSVMFRRVEDERIYLDSVGGVSATNLINRFAHADSNIHRVVQDICQQEQQHNPDVIFAEIVHLPESRVGNIMFHPTSRAYEIPYLATPAVDKDHQLPLSDLRVSVRGGRIVLRSARLDKEIVPRLSVAHNYRLSELAVYRFLCDLQGQGLRTHLSFNWGALAAHTKFLPRVTYKKVILHPATWKLQEEDFAELKAIKESRDFYRAFLSFQAKWRLPKQWVLADGDNELFVDSEQPQIVEAWWDLARKRDQLTIKEFFAPAAGAVVNERGETHAHQLVATWIKQAPTYQQMLPHRVEPEATTRSFSPGSAWLYYKIYCGVSTTDRVLEEVVTPLIEQLQAEKKIHRWFFIRYADPNHHIRLRFHLTNTKQVGEVIQQVQTAISPFEVSNTVSHLQLDTYQRELERYAGSAIKEAEALFYYDSEALLQFLSLTEGDAREDLRWLWGLRSIDTLLNNFGLTTSAKLDLMQSMKDSFAREHRMDKPLKLQIDKKYRNHRSAIGEMLALDDPEDEFYPLIEVLQNRSVRQASTIATLRSAEKENRLSPSLNSLLRSYIHMLVNRLMPSQARLHEMVLYDFLYREYRSAIAREGIKEDH